MAYRTFDTRQFCKWIFANKQTKVYREALAGVDRWIERQFIRNDLPISEILLNSRVRRHVINPFAEEFTAQMDLQEGPTKQDIKSLVDQLTVQFIRKYHLAPRHYPVEFHPTGVSHLL